MQHHIDANTAVAVVGAGSMGAGIAQLAAQAGHPVRLFDAEAGAAERALARIDADLNGAVERGRIDAAERTAVLGRLGIAGSIDHLAGCGLAVEAIVERLDAKQALFRQLEAVLGEQAVLATNTSSISISAVAQGLAQPQRVIGWHFFNPATRMKLVEVICGVETDPALAGVLHALGSAWGKTSVDAPNAPGFIVNRVARPYYAEGLRLLADRIAAPQAIDRLLREAGGFALGPFELIDLIGADVNLSVSESVFAATGYDARYAPHLTQQELVCAGRLGRKAGRGFYDYRPGAEVLPVTVAAPAVAVPVVQAAGDCGLLEPLVGRLRRAGLVIETDAALATATLSIGSVLLALTDGRTAAERSALAGEPLMLLDLAYDVSTTSALGATGSVDALGALAAVLQPAGIELIGLADVAGMIVMRIVACLVNEAADLMTWTGTRAADIDTAMRLGTAYPIGPLAWADAIGLSTVVRVLTHLQAYYGGMRYRRAPLFSARLHGGGSFHG